MAIKVFRNNFYGNHEISVLEKIEEDVEKVPKSNYLISMLGHFSNDPYTCIVFPLYGLNLFDALNKKGTAFRLEEVRTIASQLINATMFLHRKNMLHSDIKTANILFRHESNFAENCKLPDIILCDLGSVYLEDQFGYQTIGTLPYRAPDVVMGYRIGYRCDVWSIGCTMFELYTKKVLFDVTSTEELLVLIHNTLENFTMSQIEGINDDSKGIEFPRPGDYNHLDNDVKDIEVVFEKIKEKDEPLYEVIKCMLIIDPRERITLSKAALKPFFKSK